MKIRAIHTRPYALPIARGVLPGSDRAHSEGTIVAIDDETGRTGFGDAASWPEGPRPDELPMAGVEVTSLEDVERIVAECPGPARYGVELALLDLLAQERGLTIARLLNPEARDEVATHALVADARSALRARRRGHAAVKVKVGRGLWRDDIERLAAIRAVVGDDVGVRVDANGRWTTERALEATPALLELGVEWIEQPVQDLAGMRAVREAGLRVLADEIVTDPYVIGNLRETRAADGVVLKPRRLGGLLPARHLAHQAHRAGLGVCVTHSMDSAVGRIGALHLAAALEPPPMACGLAGVLGADVTREAAPDGGVLRVPIAPGLGLRARGDA